jgi:antitoxin Phd
VRVSENSVHRGGEVITKVYTYSEAREKLATILEESKTEEVVIKRRKGDMYAIIPQFLRTRHSPFDVPGLNKRILDAIHEWREWA